MCDLAPLEGDQRVDIGVRVVRVGGQLLLKGITLAANAPSPGVLVFRNLSSGSQVVSPLAPQTLHHETVLLAGTYQVLLDCKTNQAGLPHQEMVLFKTLDIPADTTLNPDAQVITVQGEVILDAGPLASDSQARNRGQLIFRRTDLPSSVSTNLGASGNATFELSMFAGAYDVLVDATVDQSVLPRQSVVALAGQALLIDQSVTVALHSVPIHGQVTVKGTRMKDEPDGHSRGSVWLRRTDTGHQVMLDVGATGEALFSGRVFQGTHDIGFTGGVEQKILPAQRFLLYSNRPFTEETRINLDVDTATVSGQVTLDGQPLPDDPNRMSRGVVFFRQADSGVVTTVELGATGPARYNVVLLAGAYDIGVDTSRNQEAMPRVTLTMLTRQVLHGSVSNNLDLPTLAVSGEATVNGRTYPTTAEKRGNLWFRRVGGTQRIQVVLPEAGSATWETRLVPGHYDVGFTPDQGQTILPRTETVLHHALRIDAPMQLPLDLRAVVISGSLSTEGFPQGSAGNILLRWHRPDTGQSTPWPEVPPGSRQFTTTLFAGSYDVDIALPAGSGMPAITAVVQRACAPLQPFCESASDNVTGRWFLRFEDVHLAPLTLELTQTQEQLSGRVLQANEGWVAIQHVSRTVTDVEMTVDASTMLHMRVMNGCLMAGYQHGVPPKRFVAERW